jgi:hypothetical protein
LLHAPQSTELVSRGTGKESFMLNRSQEGSAVVCRL